MNLFIPDPKLNTALLSADKKYRYWLLRTWDLEKPLIMFVGLNPSKANETKNDPTIRRVISISKNLGYGGVYMLNLFPYVTPYPKELKECSDFQLLENDRYIEKLSKSVECTICAWGNYKKAAQQVKDIYPLLTKPMALQINKNGSPKHPLYVKGDTIPVKYQLK